MGLFLKSPRKNMERMEEYVQGFDYQAHQQFLSDSPWKHEELINQIASDSSLLLGGRQADLIFDESYFEKQGKMSVGVARQWNGRLGKVENSQVGVFGVLSNGIHSGLVNYRLYLPESWTEDEQRCNKAKIPKESREFKKKSDLILDMIDQTVKNKTEFGWVLADGGYGKEPQFLRSLADRNLTFAVDVHKDQSLYEEKPRIFLPESNGKGRKPTRLRTDDKSIEIAQFFETSDAENWDTYQLRDTTRGTLKVKAKAYQVWLWDGKEDEPRLWWAICSKQLETEDTKYFLCNASASVPLLEMLRHHARRYFVERTFQDAKGSVGMADYQVRGWLAWHHHMALVALAMLFLLEERAVHNRKIDLLSCNDIVELLDVYLPRTAATPEEVVRNIERRHKKRRDAIEAARRREPDDGNGMKLC